MTVRERTLCIIKPDAVAAGQAGQILARLEKAGFEIGYFFPGIELASAPRR